MSSSVKKFLVLIIPFLFVSCGKKEDTKTIKLESRTLFEIADSLSSKALYDSSNQILIPSLDHLLSDSSYSLYVDALNKIADNFYDLGIQDSVLKYSELAIKFSNENLDTINLGISKTYYNLSLVNLDKRKFNEASEFCNKSLEIRKALLKNKSPLIGDNYNLLGNIEFYQHHPHKALEFYKSALKLRKNRGFYDKSVALTYMNLGNIYNDLYDFEKSISYFDTASFIQKKISVENTTLLAIISLNKASSYDKIGELDSAIISSKNALRILKKNFGEKHPYIGLVFNNLAILYGSYGDYTKAIEYIRKSIEIKENLGAEYNTQLIENYAALGEAYKETGEYDKSIIEFEKALSILRSSRDIDWEITSDIKKLLSISYLNAGKIKKALKVGLEAVNELRNSKEFDKFREIKSKIYLSEIFTKLNQYDKSIKNSIVCINYLENTKHLDWLIYSYNNLAAAYFLKGDFNAVIGIYKKVENTFSNENNSQKLDLEKINGIRGANGLFSNILNLTGQSYYNLYQRTAEEKYLSNITPVYNLLMELFATNYSKVAFESSKFNESEEFHKFFQSGIEAEFNLFKLHPNKESFENVLKLSEFNKSLTVLENLSVKSAFSMVNVPPDKLNEIKTIRRKINSYLRKLESGNSQALSEKDKQFFNSQIINANLEYEKIKSDLENEYPVLKSIIELNLDIKVDRIRNNLLDSNQTAIEYYLTKNNLYAFIISHNAFDIIRTKIPSDINIKIERLNYAIKNMNKYKFIHSSKEIYDLVFQKIDKKINTKRILIITDGVLGFIPFEALLYNSPNEHTIYKDLPYLIKKYSIGYAFSFNILEKSKSGIEKITNYLGIAPFSKY